MTPEQQSLFIKILQHGFSTGAATRFECLHSFIQSYPAQTAAAISAAAAFERGCCFCPEQAEALEEMSDQDFAQWVSRR